MEARWRGALCAGDRRTAATLLDARGVGLAAVADMLGLAGPSTTVHEYLGR